MTIMATITSKRQLTIPASIYKKLGFGKTQKVVLREEGGVIKIESAEASIERIMGSVAIPKRFKNKSLKEIVKTAKKEYFQKK